MQAVPLAHRLAEVVDHHHAGAVARERDAEVEAALHHRFPEVAQRGVLLASDELRRAALVDHHVATGQHCGEGGDDVGGGAVAGIPEHREAIVGGTRAVQHVITSYSIHYTKLYEAWDAPRSVVDAFRSAIIRDVDRIIVTPGIGDRPLWMSSETGKLIGQFKSFGFASVQRTLIPALQDRDMGVVNGLALSGAMGMLRITSYNVCYTKLLRMIRSKVAFAAVFRLTGLCF